MNNEEKDIQVNILGVVATAMKFKDVDIVRLASACDVSVPYLLDIFSCKRKISFILLAKIQKALDVKLEVRAI